MARKGRKQYRRKRRALDDYLPGAVSVKLDVGALSAKKAVSQVFPDTVTERTRISSIRASYTLDEYTAGVDDGPVMVGIAHSDYTAQQIEDWIEQLDSWDVGALVSREISKRLIRKVGIFKNPADATGSSVLNDGRPIRTKLNWPLNTGETLQLWAYNLGASNLAGTNPNLSCEGKANLWSL